MKTWDLQSLAIRPHSPEILESGGGGRAIMLEIPAGESLEDHQVHEYAWVSVVSGEVEFTTAGGERVSGGSGLMVRFALSPASVMPSMRARRRGCCCC